MDTRPSDELIAKWRAEYATHLDKLKQEALEDFDRRWLRETSDGKESLPSPSAAQRLAAPPESTPRSNGSPAGQTGTPTRRQMVMEVMPEFRGGKFTRADIEAKILEKYPNADAPYLSSNISNLLKEMADKGQLERVERGERIQDPIIYRKKVSNEETLLKS
jgi:hypothetical protein